MEAQTKLGETVKEFDGRGVIIKRIWVRKLLVPSLVDDFHYEVLVCHVHRFVEGMVISPGFVFYFGLIDFCSRRDCVIVECDDGWY